MEQGSVPSMLLRCLLATRPALSSCRRASSLGRAITSQLIALCKAQDVSKLSLIVLYLYFSIEFGDLERA